VTEVEELPPKRHGHPLLIGMQLDYRVWHITCTENHWVNEVTTLQYTDEPYVNRTRKELKLSSRHSCLVISGRFKTQLTNGVLKFLEESQPYIAVCMALN